MQANRLPRIPVRPSVPVILYFLGNRLAALKLSEVLPLARSWLRTEDQVNASDPSGDVPVSLARGITANEARLGEMLGELSVDKRSYGVPVGLGSGEERLSELIRSTFGVNLDERAISRVLLLIESGIFGRGRGLRLVDDLLACGVWVSTLWANHGRHQYIREVKKIAGILG